jgi:hypothetical protein
VKSIASSLAALVLALAGLSACDAPASESAEPSAGTASVEGTVQGVTLGQTAALLTTADIAGIGPQPALLIGAAATACPVEESDAPLLQLLLVTEEVTVGVYEVASQQALGLFDTAGCGGETLTRGGQVEIAEVAADGAVSGSFSLQITEFTNDGSEQACTVDRDCPAGEVCVGAAEATDKACKGSNLATLTATFEAPRCDGTFVCSQTD